MNFVEQKKSLPGGQELKFPITNTTRIANSKGEIVMYETINPKIDYHIGDIVKYFHYDTLSEEGILQNIFLYRILAFASMIKGSKRGERLVIYQALYNEFETFAMPLNEFRSSIDKEKYPNSKQDFLYEVIKPPYKVE